MSRTPSLAVGIPLVIQVVRAVRVEQTIGIIHPVVLWSEMILGSIQLPVCKGRRSQSRSSKEGRKLQNTVQGHDVMCGRG